MSLRYTAVLLLVLAGLGAYVYLVEFPREQRAEQEKAIFALDADAVESVTLTRGDASIEIERRDGEWHLVAPVQARADATAVEALVAAVADCKVDKDLGSQGDDMARFGLAEPTVAVTLGTGGGESVTVRVGKAAPVGNAAYIQRNAETNILLTGAAFRTSVDKKLDDLRERRLFDFEDDDVRWFEIRRGEARVRLERDADAAWQMLEPGGFGVDEGAVRTFLSSLRALRVATFVADEPASVDEFGLGTPPLEIAFATGNDAATVRTVQFGGEKAETEIYARTADSQAVYTVNDWAFRNLDKSPRDLRDKRLTGFAAADARAIQVVRRNGDDFRLVRDGDAWRVEGATGTPKKDEIDQYVKDVADLAGYEIISDDPAAPPAGFGFDDPVLQLSVYGDDDELLDSVVVGRTEADGGMQNFNARNTRGSMVVLVRAYAVNRLDRDPSALVAGAPTPTAAPADAAAD